MFSKLFRVIAITAAALAANAQHPPTIPPCVLACVIPAATLNHCNFTDAACVCGSAQFQADAAACLTAHCSASDIMAAKALQDSECAVAGVTPIGMVTTTHSIPFHLSSTASHTASTTSGTASRTSHTGSTSTTTTFYVSSSTSTAPVTYTSTSIAYTNTSGTQTSATSTTSPAVVSAAAAATGLELQNGATAIIVAVLAYVLAL